MDKDLLFQEPLQVIALMKREFPTGPEKEDTTLLKLE
jgi:hypothetical protein